MTDRAWKAFERRVGKRLKGRRIPVTGIDRHGSDVETSLLCEQVKLGRRLPEYLETWLTGIVGTAERKGKLGLVIWKPKNKHDANALAILRLADLEDLYGKIV